MLILIHVIIALSGLGLALYGLIAPSKRKMYVTYGLTAGTVGSGALLIVLQHAPMLQTCMSGLTYLAVILAATAVTRHRLRLAHQRER